jgi:hypothetical protein
VEPDPGAGRDIHGQCFLKPGVSGDWNRDGSTDSQQNTAIYPAFRTGMMEHLNQIRALMPGKLVTGNIGDWGRPEATVPEFKGQLDGGLLEHYIGQTWSNEGVDLNGNSCKIHLALWNRGTQSPNGFRVLLHPHSLRV